MSVFYPEALHDHESTISIRSNINFCSADWKLPSHPDHWEQRVCVCPDVSDNGEAGPEGS